MVGYTLSYGKEIVLDRSVGRGVGVPRAPRACSPAGRETAQARAARNCKCIFYIIRSGTLADYAKDQPELLHSAYLLRT